MSSEKKEKPTKELFAAIRALDQDRWTEGIFVHGAVDGRDEMGRTVLHRLARSKNAPAKWILQAALAGCDLEARDVAGWTALQEAAYRGRADVVEMLLEVGADPEAASKGMKFGVQAQMTAGQFAAAAGRVEAYEALHRKLGGRIPCVSRAGRPIFLAVIGGRDAMVERLFELGSRLEVVEAPGMRAEPSLASAAIRKSQKSTFDLLVRLGAPLDEAEKNNVLARPLHDAAGKKGTTYYLEELIARGVKIDALTDRGWTAMHVAAELDNEKAVRLLLQAGSDPRIETNLGRSVARVAAHHGAMKVLKALLELNPDLLMEEPSTGAKSAFEMLDAPKKALVESWILGAQAVLPKGKRTAKSL